MGTRKLTLILQTGTFDNKHPFISNNFFFIFITGYFYRFSIFEPLCLNFWAIRNDTAELNIGVWWNYLVIESLTNCEPSIAICASHLASPASFFAMHDITPASPAV